MIQYEIKPDGECYATIEVCEGSLKYVAQIDPAHIEIIEKYIADANAVIASGIALYWIPNKNEKDQINVSFPYLIEGFNFETIEERIAYAQREIEEWRRDAPELLKVDDRFILSEKAAKFRKVPEATGNTLYWEYIYSYYKAQLRAAADRRRNRDYSLEKRNDDNF